MRFGFDEINFSIFSSFISDPHPHCQVWATDFLPNEARVKHRTQKDYSTKHNGNVLLLDYIQRELNQYNKERVVIEHEH